MTDDRSEPKIEIDLPGEDPEPPEYQRKVDFGERIREEFTDYSWDLYTLSGTDGEPRVIPTLPACIESAFRIQVAGTLDDATFPDHVYDAPDADADLVVTDQDLGMEEIAVSVSATDADSPPHGQTGEPAPEFEEHWEITLRYRLRENETTTADAVSSSSISVQQR